MTILSALVEELEAARGALLKSGYCGAGANGTGDPEINRIEGVLRLAAAPCPGREDAPVDATHMRHPEYITAWLFDGSTMPIWLIERFKSNPLPEDRRGHYATALDGEFWRWFEPERFHGIFTPLPPAPASQDSPTRPDGLGGAGETFADASDSEWDDLFFAINRGTSVNSARKWRERLNALRAALAAKPAPAAVDPAAFGEVREASREEIARIIDPDAFADPNALSPIARFIREARLPERQIAALAKSDAILALSSLPAGGEAWQPIETAPKDGTPIFLLISGREMLPWSDYWDEQEEFWTYYHQTEDYLRCMVEPTHWMPLPSPPQNVTDSEDLSTGEMVHRTSESASAPIGQDVAEKNATLSKGEL